jgi:hypothetical protein
MWSLREQADEASHNCDVNLQHIIANHLLEKEKERGEMVSRR